MAISQSECLAVLNTACLHFVNIQYDDSMAIDRGSTAIASPWLFRARHFPLPDGPGQVKLPVGQVDLDRFFFFISYKQIEEFKNSWSQASDDFEKKRALHFVWWIQWPCFAGDRHLLRHSCPPQNGRRWTWSSPQWCDKLSTSPILPLSVWQLCSWSLTIWLHCTITSTISSLALLPGSFTP